MIFIATFPFSESTSSMRIYGPFEAQADALMFGREWELVNGNNPNWFVFTSDESNWEAVSVSDS